jgi:hypothetical protein
LVDVDVDEAIGGLNAGLVDVEVGGLDMLDYPIQSNPFGSPNYPKTSAIPPLKNTVINRFSPSPSA